MNRNKEETVVKKSTQYILIYRENKFMHQSPTVDAVNQPARLTLLPFYLHLCSSCCDVRSVTEGDPAAPCGHFTSSYLTLSACNTLAVSHIR